MRLIIGSDHAGFHLKSILIDRLREAAHAVADAGTHSPAPCDYADVAHSLADSLLRGEAERGLLVCGTGQGMAMAANRSSGIRAAVVSDTFSARMTALHNDANVLCLGARVVGEGLAFDIVDVWLATAFERGRHLARIAKIERPSV